MYMTNPDKEKSSPAASAEETLPYKTGQLCGIVSGTVSCVLWMLTIWDPASVFSFSIAGFAVVFAMILISIIAIIASIKGHGTALIVLFAVAFFPIGLYVIAVPHWIRWTGLANLGFLAAGLLIRQGRQKVSG